MSKSSLFNNFKNFMAKHYGESHGRMLIHTGVIGWVLSATAQVFAIVTNDKISNKQKMYIIPQELADAAVNIASFYLITQSFKTAATKAINCGKILSKPIRKYLEENHIKNVGKTSFDVLENGKLTPKLIEQFKAFRNGMDFIATTTGSIISCNIVTPIVRNEIATYKQKKHIERFRPDETPLPHDYLPRPSIQSFQARAYTSSDLKI